VWADLPAGPTFLGILNLTPDSFSDGGRWVSAEAALARAVALVGAGARILDLGAESTRPGAEPVSEDEEWHRLEPLIRALGTALPTIPLSLDTRHAGVAARGLAAGIAILNDVTGFQGDMLALARRCGAPLLAMRSRIRGGSFWMPPYEGPGETSADRAIRELGEVRDRLLGAGIPRDRIVLDPGFGFGTTWTEDRALWDALPELAERLAWPRDRICLGISRKRFTAHMAGDPGLAPGDRDAITARLHARAAGLGYRLLRTHALPTEVSP
jgi:dihydropteroate synthase